MVEIVLSVCLVANPYKCRDVILERESDQEVSLVACMMNSQIAAAQWSLSHPGHIIRRTKCRPARVASKA